MMTPEALFDVLIDKIPDAKKGKMFGCECAKMLNGKAGMMLKNGSLIVKISPEIAAKEQLQVFTPMENRPMNGWYVVPFEDKEKWRNLAEISCKNVAALEPNSKKKKK